MSRIIEPPSPLRASIDHDKLAELARSMAAEGQLQAILLRETEAGFVIRAGHRRYLAARSLGWETIEAKVLPPGTGDDVLKSFAENVHREDLSPLEEARVLYDLVIEGGLDVDLAAARFGKSRAWIDGRLELLNYPSDLIEALHVKDISLGVARELARVSDDGYRGFLLSSARENGATAKTARNWANAWEADHIATGQPTTAGPEPPLPYQGQSVGIACGGCDTLYPIAHLRPIYVCPECHLDHHNTKATARAEAGRRA